MKARIARSGQKLIAYGRANPNVPEAVFAFAIKLVGAALSFGFSFLIARFLGAEVTGGFALTLTTALFASTIALFGLDYVLLRAMAGNVRAGETGMARGAARTATITTAGFAIIVGAILALFGDIILNQWLKVSLDHQLVVIAGIVVLPLVLIRIAVMALRGAGHVLAGQFLEGPLAMGMSVIALGVSVFLGRDLTATGVAFIYFSMVTTAGIIAWIRYLRTVRAWEPATAIPVGPMLSQGSKISFIVLSRSLLDWIVLIVLAAHFSVFVVGQFRTAWQVTSMIGLILTTFETVSGPRIAAAHKVNDFIEIRRIMRQATSTMMALAMPLFILTLVFPEFVLGLFGPEFVEASSALRILALGQLVNILSGPLGSAVMMTGEERRSAQMSLGSLVVLGVLCLTLIPAYGMIGAALTTSLTIAFRTCVLLFIVQKTIPRQ